MSLRIVRPLGEVHLLNAPPKLLDLTFFKPHSGIPAANLLQNLSGIPATVVAHVVDNQPAHVHLEADAVAVRQRFEPVVVVFRDVADDQVGHLRCQSYQRAVQAPALRPIRPQAGRLRYRGLTPSAAGTPPHTSPSPRARAGARCPPAACWRRSGTAP